MGLDLRRSALVLGIALSLGFGIQQFPTGAAAPTAGSPISSAPTGSPATTGSLAAPAQSALDAVLGPNHSVVTASATYTRATTRQSSTYNGKQAAPLARSSASGPGYQASVTDNGVSRSVTNSTTGGQIQRLSVAVVVDSALRPAPKLTAIRTTVSAALGLQPSRGDKITVVALPLPGVAPAGSSAAAGNAAAVTRITPYLRSALAGVIALVLLLALLFDALARRRRGGP